MFEMKCQKYLLVILCNYITSGNRTLFLSRLEIYRHAGCFQDGANSALCHILGVTTKVQECYKLAVSYGYKVFAFKFGQICMSGKGVTTATFAKRKKSNQCRNGLDSLKAVDVYGITYKGKLLCFHLI